MHTIAWLLLLAAFLPYGCAILAKVAGQGFDNHAPRVWLARQTGWRARADAAQQNLFEGLPLYYAAVLFAWLGRGVQADALVAWMIIWVVLRVGYVVTYVMDRAALRSLLWALALAANLWILFGLR